MRLVLSLFAAAFLTVGCGGMVKSKVTAFHSLQPSDYEGAKYAIVPMESQYNNLEFQTYANILSAKLAVRGVSQVSPTNADYLIYMDYAMGESYNRTYSYDTYGQTGTQTQVTGVRDFGDGLLRIDTQEVPTYGKTGTNTGSERVHTRLLNVVLVDIRNETPKIAYESRVTSEGSNSEISTVMPAMLEAVVEHFPGEPGKEKTYTGSTE